MAGEKNTPVLSQETKETLIKAGLIVVLGSIVLKKIDAFVFGDPGPVDLIPESEIDYPATQVRKFITNHPNMGDYVEIKDPWKPTYLADTLYTAMNGLNMFAFGETDRSKAWREVSRLGNDRLKWLHNYWLQNLDRKDTLYRWIWWEQTTEYSEEEAARAAAISALENAGIAF